MLEMLFGLVLGLGVGTYNHEKFEPCFQPIFEELITFKDRLQNRLDEVRRNQAARPTTKAATRSNS